MSNKTARKQINEDINGNLFMEIKHLPSKYLYHFVNTVATNKFVLLVSDCVTDIFLKLSSSLHSGYILRGAPFARS